MAAFTSGDWWINYISPWSMVQSGKKILIYFRYGEEVSDEECKANVRLIAHAPQLHELLRKGLEDGDPMNWDEVSYLLDKIKDDNDKG